MLVPVPDSSREGRDEKNTLAAQSERQSFQFMLCMNPLLLPHVLLGPFHSTLTTSPTYDTSNTDFGKWI